MRKRELEIVDLDKVLDYCFMKKIVLLLVVLNVCSSFAQDIEVKKFEPLEKDQTATLSPRKDINGVTCGLVKVLLKEPGAEFEGSVMGDVQFTGKEYLVYLPNGTKRLGIKHPDYLPTTIVFADYGTKKVASATTYELKVKTNKKQAKVDNSKKGMAVFNIKPSNAMLLIDGEIADGSGGAYTLSLPYGTHYYTVKLKDFSITNQAVKIDKNAKTIDVDLTEYFAKVNVSCNTGDASISVNNEQKGLGKWKGLVIPGKCTVEATKEGFHSQSKSFELMDGDSINVKFAELKAITGSLRVENELKDCEVFLNGKKVGTTPWGNKNLPIGEYNVEIRHKYYTPLKRSVIIHEDQELILREKLYQTQMDKLLMSADMRDPRAYGLLAILYIKGSDYLKDQDNNWGVFYDNNDEPVYFINKETFLKDGTVIKKDLEKAAYWGKLCVENVEPEYEYVQGQVRWCFSEELMIRYLTGNGVPKDYTQSFFWANHGYACTLNFWIAWHYFYGRGVQKDLYKALNVLNGESYLDKSNNGPYKTCSREIFERLSRPSAKQYDWDPRLLEIFDKDK